VKWKSVLLVAFVCARQASSADEIAREMLDAHNAARAGVGVPPLAWSNKLEAVAREWAESLAASGAFRHRPNSDYGENLCDIRGGKATPAQVVNEWTAEAKDYDPAKNTCRAGAVCGHYTQVVWRRTSQVGCAAAVAGRREVWVCNYDPPGNWARERPY
jgi:pathogenesis-related protein 1